MSSKDPLVVWAFSLNLVSHCPHIVVEGKLSQGRLPVLFSSTFDCMNQQET